MTNKIQIRFTSDPSSRKIFQSLPNNVY